MNRYDPVKIVGWLVIGAFLFTFWYLVGRIIF